MRRWARRGWLLLPPPANSSPEIARWKFPHCQARAYSDGNGLRPRFSALVARPMRQPALEKRYPLSALRWNSDMAGRGWEWGLRSPQERPVKWRLSSSSPETIAIAACAIAIG